MSSHEESAGTDQQPRRLGEILGSDEAIHEVVTATPDAERAHKTTLADLHGELTDLRDRAALAREELGNVGYDDPLITDIIASKEAEALTMRDIQAAKSRHPSGHRLNTPDNSPEA